MKIEKWKLLRLIVLAVLSQTQVIKVHPNLERVVCSVTKIEIRNSIQRLAMWCDLINRWLKRKLKIQLVKLVTWQHKQHVMSVIIYVIGHVRFYGTRDSHVGCHVYRSARRLSEALQTPRRKSRDMTSWSRILGLVVHWKAAKKHVNFQRITWQWHLIQALKPVT